MQALGCPTTLSQNITIRAGDLERWKSGLPPDPLARLGWA